MEEKLETILLDLNIGYITVKVAKRKILRLFDVMESDCDHEWVNDSFDHFGFLTG
jgi:hypothetical protein